MKPRFARSRRFRFNLPQRVAAGLLLLFLAQGCWQIVHQTLSERDYAYARCGQELWDRPVTLTGSLTSCGAIRDGVLAYRLAGLSLNLDLLVEEGLDHFRKPEDRIVQVGGEISPWELRHQLSNLRFLLRLPFLAVGCVLGGCLWWVTRRLYGNLGGYTALSLYCFSPAILQASTAPNAEILAALAVYGGIYTCIGVAHAMQGPRRKWRPRIVLLTAAFGVAAAAHLAALAVVAVLGLGWMLWLAEGRRIQIASILGIATAGALGVVLLCYSLSFEAVRSYFHGAAGAVSFSLEPVRRFFCSLPEAGITVAAVAALLLYLGFRRSRYFGNSAPLLATLLLMPLGTVAVPSSPWLWALPFLLTFVAGVWADAYEGRRGRLAIAAAVAVVLLQAACCAHSLLGGLQ
jgi:hypothetical protein